MKNKYIDYKFPKKLEILPVPFTESNNDIIPIGIKKELNDQIAPDGSKWYQPTTFCNILPPPPRSQIKNFPLYPTKCSKCKKYKDSPFKPKKYYLLNSKMQGVEGLVQGAEDNSNFIRGNQFSNHILPKLKKSQRPVQIPLENVILKEKKYKIKANSPFYPYPNYRYSKEKKYLSYPKTDNFINGQPTYSYPYDVINMDKYIDNNINKNNLPLLNNRLINKICTENFNNKKNINKFYTRNVIAIVTMLFIVIILLLMYRE